MGSYVCTRCEKTAGFWVCHTEGAVSRRPWCLKCIDAYLKRSEHVIKRIR